ncbi:hypothetical protein ACQKND_16040 [Viridibacillus arvi]|uniref:hypothetical protein n=1 Tax=Viridibacillus arvi TaxID=263475 RepID=UPI003D07AC73
MCKNKHDCKCPKECQDKRNTWLERTEKYVPIGRREHKKFIERMKSGEATIVLDRHLKKRKLERSVNTKDLLDVFYDGWVIERNKTDGPIALVLMGYVGKHRQPLHVVIHQLAGDKWIVITSYNPQTHHWKWSDNYNERVCFCNFDDE